MDILLDNPLATMYGPYFLILYGFFIFFVLVLFGLAKISLDRTDTLPVPPIPIEIDPFEIAYLRGGEHETARAVVFSLVQKGLAEVKFDGKTGMVERLNPDASTSGLLPIEQLALKWIGSKRETSELFASDGLSVQLDGYARTFQARLEAQNMLTGDDAKNRLSRFKRSVMASIVLLGGYKIITAITHDNYNFAGIVVLALIGIAIAAGTGKPARITKLGKAFLECLQLAFENLKYQSQSPYIAGQNRKKTSPKLTSAIDPLVLSVGVFGAGILVGTVFDTYNEAFRRAQQQSAAGSCGSGCGSSCSSGDSGGSSCGGGCGGCGGGGD